MATSKEVDSLFFIRTFHDLVIIFEHLKCCGHAFLLEAKLRFLCLYSTIIAMHAIFHFQTKKEKKNSPSATSKIASFLKLT